MIQVSNLSTRRKILPLRRMLMTIHMLEKFFLLHVCPIERTEDYSGSLDIDDDIRTGFHTGHDSSFQE